MVVKNVDNVVSRNLVNYSKLNSASAVNTDDNSIFTVALPIENTQVNDSSSKTKAQLDTICKNTTKKLDNIPFPFSLMGKDKIKSETLSLVNNPEFRSGVVSILEEARAKNPNNANKSVVELVRDKNTYNKLLAYIKKSASSSKTITSILNNQMVEGKLYEYLSSDKAMEILNEA